MHCKVGLFDECTVRVEILVNLGKTKEFGPKSLSFLYERVKNSRKMHSKDMDFTDFLLHCKDVILKPILLSHIPSVGKPSPRGFNLFCTS